MNFVLFPLAVCNLPSLQAMHLSVITCLSQWLGQLFNTGTVTRFLQISSSQPAPNSDEERELNAAFLTHGVHVTMEADNGDDVEELPTPVEWQGSKHAGKLPSQTASLTWKKRKGESLGEMTDAINNFTEMSRQRLRRDSESRPQSVDSTLGGDRFSMDRAIEILNSIENADDFTVFKILKELIIPTVGLLSFHRGQIGEGAGWIWLVV